jgi:two-component system, cell cycle sensor histidine kinase and response regulator CckA
MLVVSQHAAALAARLTGGFAGVCWTTDLDGEAGQWLIAEGQKPEWLPDTALASHPWQAHEPLVRTPIPGAPGLNLVASSAGCEEAIEEVAALLAAGWLTSTAPRLRHMLESIDEGVVIIDREWRISYVNRYGASVVNALPSDLIGRPLLHVLPESRGSQIDHVCQQVFETGASVCYEAPYPPLNAWFQVKVFRTGDELAIMFAETTVHRERTEHLQQVEAQLRQALNRLRRIADSSRDMICTWTADGRYETVSKAVERILGYTPEEMRGMPLFDLVAPADLEETRQVASAIRVGQAVSSYRNRLRHKDGHLVHIDWSSVWSPEENIGFAVARDITSHVEAESWLLESEERYRLIFDLNPQQMWMYDDENYQILAVNEAALARYGYTREEFLNLTVFDLVHPDEKELAYSRLITHRQPGPRSGLWKHHRKDGAEMIVMGWSHPLPLAGRPARLSVAIDVTQERKLEEQLRQAQKMEAIGELAGGIAHDFNNLLTVINGYAEMGLRAAAGTQLEPMLAAIEQAGDRAALLTSQLLAFSRRQVLQPELVSLNQIVHRVEPMLRRIAPESLDIALRLSPDLAPVRADAAQFEHVLLNLVINARDAMEGRHGRIVIETFNVMLGEDFAATHADVQPGPHVLMTVTDSGHGMDAATVTRIFEPFFTTKPRGRGTGLGLPMVYGIVKQSGGHMSVYSEPGIGTTMKVYLPATEALPGEVPPLDDSTPSVPAATGTETILLVEDDERVRRFTRTVLEDLGYQVIEAEDGNTALEQADAGGEIHLLLSDVVLPRLGGREVAQRLAPRRPQMRVLFISGYTENAIVHHGVLDAGLNFLPKPFSPDSLARKVREVLDAPLRPRCVLLAAPAGPARDEMNRVLQEVGYSTILAATSAECVEHTRRRAIDLILSPLELPGHTPSEALSFLREEFPHIRIAALLEPRPDLRPDTFIPATTPARALVEAVRALTG